MKIQRNVQVWVALAVLTLALTLPRRALADPVGLSLAGVSGLPGTSVTVLGNIVNSSASAVYLNGEDFTLGSAAFLNGDPTEFFLNAPLSLDPGQSSGQIGLFTFGIAAGTAPGVYGGNSLDIIGGGPSDFSDILASAPFSVDVQGATAAPEPPAILLLLTGILMLFGGSVAAELRRRRRDGYGQRL